MKERLWLYPQKGKGSIAINLSTIPGETNTIWVLGKGYDIIYDLNENTIHEILTLLERYVSEARP